MIMTDGQGVNIRPELDPDHPIHVRGQGADMSLRIAYGDARQFRVILVDQMLV
jgi:hypothetical protein